MVMQVLHRGTWAMKEKGPKSISHYQARLPSIGLVPQRAEDTYLLLPKDLVGGRQYWEQNLQKL